MTSQEKTLPHTSEREDQHHEETGVANPTLVGDAQSVEQSDVVGFRNEGKYLATQMDTPVEDHNLMMSLRPTDEEQHSIAKFLSRPVKVATIKWTTSAKVGSTLASFDIVREINNKNMEMVRNKLAGFYGMHATANLKILVNAQPYHQGLLQIYYIPFQRTFVSYPYAYNETEMSLSFTTGCPNTVINLATQTGGTLSVPYTGSNAFVHIPSVIQGVRDWGTFFIQNISSIQDSSNDARAQISVYMYFTDVKLFGATPLVWKPQADRNFEELVKRTGSKLLSGTPLSGVCDSVPEILDALGFSKPVVNQNPSRMLISPFANLALTNSTSAALKVSATQEQAVTIGQLGVDSVDEMSISHIISKPCYLKQFVWSTSQTSGTSIDYITVNPNATITATVNQGVDEYIAVGNSRLRYVANLFRFWRGDIVYTFHVVATKFHSGRLRLVYNVGGDLPSGEYGQALPYTFSEILDLRDGVTFDVVCPYFCSTPWRPIPKRWDNDKARFMLDKVGEFDDLENNLQIIVENDLVVSGAACSSVSIIVMVRGASNLQFAGPTTSRSVPFSLPVKTVTLTSAGAEVSPPPNFDPEVITVENNLSTKLTFTNKGRDGKRVSTVSPTQHFRKKGNLIGRINRADYSPPSTTTAKPQGDKDMKTINMVSMIIPPFISDVRAHEYTIGEQLTNLRPLLRRYFQIGSALLSGNAQNNFLVFPFTFVQPNLGYMQNQALSFEYFHYISYLYRFYRGGIRHLFKTSGDSQLVCSIKYDPDIRTSIGGMNLVDSENSQFGKRSPLFKISSDDAAEFSNLPFAASIPVYPPLTGGIEIEIPYYCKAHKLPFRTVPLKYADVVNAIEESIYPDGIFVVQFDTTAVDKTVQRVEHYRAAADDFNFGFLLGAPPTTLQILKF